MKSYSGRRRRAFFRKRTRPALDPWTPPALPLVLAGERPKTVKQRNRGTGAGVQRAVAREAARAQAGPRRNA